MRLSLSSPGLIQIPSAEYTFCLVSLEMAPAPPRSLPKKQGSSSSSPIVKLCKNVFSISFIKSCIFDPARLPLVSIGILIAELLLNVFVVQRVPYTEIDWKAYMQECEGFLNGTRNYSLLKGLLMEFFTFPAESINSFRPTYRRHRPTGLPSRIRLHLLSPVLRDHAWDQYPIGTVHLHWHLPDSIGTSATAVLQVPEDPSLRHCSDHLHIVPHPLYLRTAIVQRSRGHSLPLRRPEPLHGRKVVLGQRLPQSRRVH